MDARSLAGRPGAVSACANAWRYKDAMTDMLNAIAAIVALVLLLLMVLGLGLLVGGLAERLLRGLCRPTDDVPRK